MAPGTFSNQVKNELARVDFEKNCCRLAEFAAILRTSGILRISTGQQLSFTVSTDNAAVARRVFRLSKHLYAWPVLLLVRQQTRLHKRKRYLVRLMIPKSQDLYLRQLGIFRGRKVEEGIRSSLVRRQCCLRAYLRGVFLGCGSISNPESGYHLEMVLSRSHFAGELVKQLERVKLRARIVQRKQMAVVYLKEADQIADFLSLIGAHAALLQFEDIRLRKGLRNQVNRQVNCDTANVEKAVRTGLRQVEHIQYIADKMGLDWLPPTLK
ncbi:MAG: DNA-binding protein WhiA [Syntrophomonadaceae bacterium]|nr:DNA-binding protein WhiA [Syntrophomonadaceae bacterium]